MRPAEDLRDAVEACLRSLAFRSELGDEIDGRVAVDVVGGGEPLELLALGIERAEQLFGAGQRFVDGSHAASSSRATRARIPFTSRAASSVA